MVEHMVVVHVVAGSNPVIHPKFYWDSLGNGQDKRNRFGCFELAEILNIKEKE